MYIEPVRTKGEKRGAAEQLTRQLILTFGPRAGAQQAETSWAGPSYLTGLHRPQVMQKTKYYRHVE